MTFIVYLFLALFVYGLVAGKVVAALLALYFAGLIAWGARSLRQAEAEYNARKLEYDTAVALKESECEAGRSKF